MGMILSRMGELLSFRTTDMSASTNNDSSLTENPSQRPTILDEITEIPLSASLYHPQEAVSVGGQRD